MAAGLTGVYGSVEADYGMLLFSARKRRDREAAEALYAACVAAARHPALYTAYGVPDTLQGRFEMLALHLFAPIQRLMHEPGDDPDLAHLLAERFVADMDAAFREMGVSDVTVPKRMKALYRSFAGRISAYRTALGESEAALVAAVSRNVFPDGEGEACALALTLHLKQSVAAIREASLVDLRRGTAPFPAPALASPVEAVR
jgi:cytochrome b pre-mRNA-processing protein 3